MNNKNIHVSEARFVLITFQHQVINQHLSLGRIIGLKSSFSDEASFLLWLCLRTFTHHKYVY